MPNSPQLLRQILEARYTAENCSPGEQAEKTAAYEALLDEAIKGTTYTRLGLAEALRQRYIDHRKARRRQEGIPPRVD